MIETKLFGYDIKNFGKSSADLSKFVIDTLLEFLPKKLSDKLSVSQEMVNVFVSDKKCIVNDVALGEAQVIDNFERNQNILDSKVIDSVKSHLDDDKQLVLTLDDKLVLIRDIQLPAAVKDNLSQVIFYEMEKYTPFNKDSIYYDVIQTGIVGANLSAKLILVHQDELKDLLSDFSAAKLKFDRVNVASVQNANLLPVNLRRNRRFALTKNASLAILVMLLAGLCLATPLLFKRHEAIKLNNELYKIESKAAGETDLWTKRLDKEDMISDFIKNRPLPFASVLEEITKLLPDDTWVSELSYVPGKLSIRGSSKSPADLVTKLESSPFLSNVVFEGQIVRDNFRLGMNISADIPKSDKPNAKSSASSNKDVTQ